jgi:glycerol-3-phosphate acyltransferase PlsY
VRVEGTGNVGATNALVVAGPLLGALAMIGDIGKGFIAIKLAGLLGVSTWGVAGCALAAVVGHDFSIFLKFRGGKGVATTGGILLALDPLFMFLVLLLWVLAMILLRYFIPGTVLALIFIPLMMWLSSWPTPLIVFGLANALLGIYTHRKDLLNYYRGELPNIQDSFNKYLKK